jgi:ATP-binding cassette subfamily B protein
MGQPSKREQLERLPVRLQDQFWRHFPRYLVGTLLLGAYQGAQLWFDFRLRDAINAAVAGKRELALSLGASLVALALGAWVVRIWSRVVVFNAGRISEYELRSSLLVRLQKLGPAFYGRMPVGEIMSRATNDLTQVRLLLGFGILNAINTLFGLISAGTAMLSMNPGLTVAALVPVPVLMWVARRFSSQLYSRQKANQDALGKMSAQVQTSISGARIVRSFHLEDSQVALFEQTNQDYLEKSLSLARLRGSMFPVMQSITSVGVLIVFWYGGSLLMAGKLDSGELLAFFRALSRLVWPLMALGFLLGLLARGKAAYTRLAEIYQAQPEIVDGQLPPPERVTGRIEVKDLHFSYGGDEILRGVSFQLPPGGSIAIVGRTGSGKSTLAQLLPRLLNTPRGAVFLDGQDIVDLPLKTVRETVGYAAQNPFLFSTTAGENVGLALDDPASAEGRRTIRAAAQRAHVLDELTALPDGLDTVVGEKGVQLSGGQRQRVSLASAFVLAPRLLVLDDPLSAVDAETEAGILDAVDEQMAERGVILITHRVAAARRCDQILVLDDGRIVEAGSHDELCRLGRLYSSFAEEQRIEGELAKLGHFKQGATPRQSTGPRGAERGESG